jgi:hypothetical protein
MTSRSLTPKRRPFGHSHPQASLPALLRKSRRQTRMAQRRLQQLHPQLALPRQNTRVPHRRIHHQTPHQQMLNPIPAAPAQPLCHSDHPHGKPYPPIPIQLRIHSVHNRQCEGLRREIPVEAMLDDFALKRAEELVCFTRGDAQLPECHMNENQGGEAAGTLDTGCMDSFSL